LRSFPKFRLASRQFFVDFGLLFFFGQSIISQVSDLVGGVDPSHPDCPEITEAGFVTPGQRRDTGVFMTARTCEYHDHTMLGVPAFQGRIIIR